MKAFDFPIVKFTLCLVAGIIIGTFYDITLKVSLIISACFLFLLLVSYIVSRKSFKRTIWFGLVAYLTMASLGVSIKNLHNQQNLQKHYSNNFPIQNSDLHIVHLTLVETLKPNKTFNRYVANVSKINSSYLIGKVLLNVKKDSSLAPLHAGTRLILKTSLQALYPPQNPHQFNYKKYLNNQNIYAQIYTDSSSLYAASTKTNSILEYADKIRRTVTTQLENYHFKPNEMAIIKALFLGQRQDISNELRQQYVNAGAIHILAISGLHVGIILCVLNYLFGFLQRLRHGYLIKTIVLLILLWTFAIIAGLSPSVLRAVSMFSAVAIAMNLKRPYNIYNTLAISAFVLLLFNPNFLFEVGFQLSYLAVIGIVSIQPLLFNSLKTKYWIINKVLVLLTVSVAAQIGVLPLSLFYFHQFPGLFFLSNVVVIPFLGIILSCGFIVIIMALLNIPYNLLVLVFETLITWMNKFFNWVSLQEAFIFKDISFTFVMVISAYILIISAVKFYSNANYKKLVLVLCSILVLQAIYLYNDFSNNQNNEFVVFHKSRHSLIGEKQGDFLKLSHDLDSAKRQNDYIIKNYAVGNFIETINEDSLVNVYRFNEKTMLVIDSIGVYKNLSFQPDYIILRKSPKINLHRLINSIKVKAIIADGSNYTSYIKRWESTCLKQKIPFHYTGEKGAFVLD